MVFSRVWYQLIDLNEFYYFYATLNSYVSRNRQRKARTVKQPFLTRLVRGFFTALSLRGRSLNQNQSLLYTINVRIYDSKSHFEVEKFAGPA